MFILIMLYQICKIDRMTHLTEDDMLWTGKYDINTIKFFRNRKSFKMDTLKISKIILNNSQFPLMNPFLKWNCGSDYTANCFIYYEIHHEGKSVLGRFSIIVKDEFNLTELSFRLGNLCSVDSIINKKILMKENRVFLDNSNTFTNNLYQSETDSTCYLRTFTWVKGIGLESYEFEDGNSYVLWK